MTNVIHGGKLLGTLFACVFAMATQGATNISENVTLAADADWREFGLVTVAAGATVDLNGHNLVAHALAGEGQLVSSLDPADLPAPEVVGSSAIFWLDAADKSTLTLDDSGNVSAWRSKVGSQIAELQEGDVAPVYSESGFPIPCVDFGAVGCKKNLSYDRFEKIRTAFAVMKIQKRVQAAFLTDRATYDFYRGESGEYLSTVHSAANASHVWNGTREVAPAKDVIPDDDFQVLCYEMAIDARSDTLAMDRPASGSSQAPFNGGKQISELILFDTVLSESDRLAVTTYLQKKWKLSPLGAVYLDLSDEAAADCDGKSLTVGENVSVVLGDTWLAASCDLRGFGTVSVEGAVNLNGHELKVDGDLIGKGLLTSLPPAPEVIGSSAMFWLDAADKSTLTLDASGNVSAWRSKVGSQVAEPKDGDVAPVYSESGFSLPCVDFGTAGCKKNLSYDRFDKIRTAFAVMKIQKTVYAAFLTDRATYDFYRGQGGEYLNSMHSAGNASHVWNGTHEVKPTADAIPDNDFQVLCYEMAIDARSDTLAMDRPASGSSQAQYNGGKQISELILFDTVLSESNRLEVTTYLQQKWFGGSELDCATLVVDVPSGECARGAVSLKGGVRLVKKGGGAFLAHATGQTYTGGTLVEAGTFSVDGDGTSRILGAVGNALMVERSAVFDLNGNHDFNEHPLILNGGRVYSAGNWGGSYAQLATVRLGADSEACSVNMVNRDYQEVSLDLQGHALTLSSGAGLSYYLYNVTATAGSLVVNDGTPLIVDKTALRAPETTFDLNGPLTVNVPCDVGDLLLKSADARYQGEEVVKVHGTFAPSAGTYPNVQMQDRSTIDVSAFSTDLSCASGAFSLSFADNATIFVRGCKQRSSKSAKILSWDAKPVNVNTLRFKAADGENVRFEIRDDGVYFRRGLMILVQ